MFYWFSILRKFISGHKREKTCNLIHNHCPEVSLRTFLQIPRSSINILGGTVFTLTPHSRLVQSKNSRGLDSRCLKRGRKCRIPSSHYTLGEISGSSNLFQDHGQRQRLDMNLIESFLRLSVNLYGHQTVWRSLFGQGIRKSGAEHAYSTGFI